MSLDKLYQATILEYAGMKEHNHKLEDASHIERGNNPSCGDDLTILVKIENDKIEKISYLGKGCAISTASTNMLIEAVQGKEINYSKEVIKAYFKMMKEETLSDEEYDMIGEAEILGFAANMPARIKCATLSWHSLDVILNK